jgi:hypothetical protein
MLRRPHHDGDLLDMTTHTEISEQNKNLHIMFIDLEKIYNKIKKYHMMDASKERKFHKVHYVFLSIILNNFFIFVILQNLLEFNKVFLRFNCRIIRSFK